MWYTHFAKHIPTVAFLWCYRKERKINKCSKWGKCITKFSLLKALSKSSLHTILFIHSYNDIWVKNITTLHFLLLKSEVQYVTEQSLCKIHLPWQIFDFSWWTLHPKHEKTWRQNVSMTVVWRYNFLRDTYFDIKKGDSFDLRSWHLNFLCFWRMDCRGLYAFCFWVILGDFSLITSQ